MILEQGEGRGRGGRGSSIGVKIGSQARNRQPGKSTSLQLALRKGTREQQSLTAANTGQGEERGRREVTDGGKGEDRGNRWRKGGGER